MPLTFNKLSKTDSISDVLEKLFAEMLSDQDGLAMWRNPNAHDIQLIRGKCSQIDIKKASQYNGYLLSTFDNAGSLTLIEAGSAYRFHQTSFPDKMAVRDMYLSELQNEAYTQSRFIQLCQLAKKQISERQYLKLVISRYKLKKIASTFNPLSFYKNLCLSYPDAFVSFVSTPEYGTWIGASPELLLQVNNRYARTVALAGTAKSNEFTEKEIEEQQFVHQYIEEVLIDQKLEWSANHPESVRAGELNHIKTAFDIEAAGSINNWPELLNKLHPTPAVCGIPSKRAMAFLKREEKYHRGLYSGFGGPVLDKNKLDLFVNLRCLSLHKNYCILYAGAGITSGSVPTSEWAETENKIKTLEAKLKGYEGS